MKIYFKTRKLEKVCSKIQVRNGLILLLDEHGYPPVKRDEVYKDIFEQAENFNPTFEK